MFYFLDLCGTYWIIKKKIKVIKIVEHCTTDIRPGV